MQQAKIYVIDDNKTVCESLEFLFDSFYGLKAVIYHDPILFLQEFSLEWHGCILVDLFMPTMNGVELLEKLNTLRNQLPIIIMSGHANKKVADQLIQRGAYSFISKPLNIEHLLATIEPFFQK